MIINIVKETIHSGLYKRFNRILVYPPSRKDIANNSYSDAIRRRRLRRLQKGIYSKEHKISQLSSIYTQGNIFNILHQIKKMP